MCLADFGSRWVLYRGVDGIPCVSTHAAEVNVFMASGSRESTLRRLVCLCAAAFGWNCDRIANRTDAWVPNAVIEQAYARSKFSSAVNAYT